LFSARFRVVTSSLLPSAHNFGRWPIGLEVLAYTNLINT
jgi:hypothetical protein